MPKLVDLAAIYGKSNSQIVASIISNVFENDKRYVVDFKEGIEMLINLIKKTFKEYHRIQTIIKGEYVKDMSNQELQEHIFKYLSDFVEILSNITLICTTFPEEVLETMRVANPIIYMANAYCLAKQMKSDLINKLHLYIPSAKNNT